MIITASIVLYNNNKRELLENIKMLKDTIINKIFIIDNSPNDNLSIIFNLDKFEYISNPSNPGFGSSHNFAINKSIESGSNYHFVINPDIVINENVIESMIDYIKRDDLIGMMMPKILNIDGQIQYLPKLLPSPFDLLRRKLKLFSKLYNRFINIYELRFVPNCKIYNSPIISGCFTLLNLNAICDIGMYDERFFMYFEDFDLSRRMHLKYKTIYYPLVSVYHGYESAANKKIKLFKIFIISAIKYYNKWGWFFDFDRKKINKKALYSLINRY